VTFCSSEPNAQLFMDKDIMSLQNHIKNYLGLVGKAEEAFSILSKKYQDKINCRLSCDSCCSVYYELQLIEAFYVSNSARSFLDHKTYKRVLARAEEGQKQFSEAKAYLSSLKLDQFELENSAAQLVLPCPLKEDHSCVLYEHRPITCRLYGVPQQIGNRVISCPKNSFESGSQYDTIKIRGIQKPLEQCSTEFIRDLIGIVPEYPILFSMSDALLIKFDKEYFLSLQDKIGETHQE
jgi:hypothetical protein